MALAAIAIKNAKSRAKLYKFADGDIARWLRRTRDQSDQTTDREEGHTIATSPTHAPRAGAIRNHNIRKILDIAN